jgi:hypothetical protein
MAKTTTRKSGDLQIIYANKEVRLGDRTVEMRPVPLRRLPEFLGTIMSVADLTGQGSTIGQVIEALGEPLLSMLDCCLVDVSIDDLPIATAPILLETFMQQNLTTEILGKWRSLLTQIVNLIPGATDAIEQTINEAPKLPKSKQRQL